jgi:flagellar M-ring protein FliF
MDFLNTAFAQISDLFRSMTPGARLTAGLLLIVVVVSLGYLFTHDISNPSADLMNGVPISSSQLPAMVAALGKAKLTGYKIEGTQILVPHGQEAVYMAALADAKALPANFDTVMDEELSNGNFFTDQKTKEQQRKNLKEKKLGLIISLIPGIERATVLYDTDTKQGIAREKIITASVAVKPNGSEQLDTVKVSSIRHLVAGAIAGLKPESVSVFDANGRTWTGNSENGGGADDNEYVSLKRTNEQDLKAKIRDSLSFIPNVTVEATVTLDTKKKTHTREQKFDAKTTTVRQTDKSSTRTQDSSGPAGQPGFAAQQPNAPAALSANRAGGSKEEEEQSTSDVVNVPSGSETETETVGLTPKLAKVSIGIPISYFKKVWQQRNPAKDGQEQKEPDQAALDQVRTEESAKIQKHVIPLLPAIDGVADPAELVAVTTFQDIPGKEIPAPSTAQSALAWLGDYWSTLGMIGVALVSLMMLRSLIRSAPPMPETRGAKPRIASSTTAHEEEAPEPVVTAAPRLRRFSGAGPSLRDELSAMVKEDPDTAANILRGWISNAN